MASISGKAGLACPSLIKAGHSSTPACLLSLMVLEFTATIVKLLHVKNAQKHPVQMFPLMRTTGLIYNLLA
jgi:hypothetical protein